MKWLKNKLTCFYNKELQELSVNNNQSFELPTNPNQLNGLRTLKLIDNQMGYFPRVISQLTELRVLNLEGNKIDYIPDSISQLIKLEELNLMSNRLEYISRQINQLTELRTLNLMCNQITQLPDLSNLTKLEELNIGSNSITELPSYIGDFNNLKVLHLVGNKIKIIPESITKLVKENKLELSIAWNPIPKIKSEYNFYINNPLTGTTTVTNSFYILNKEHIYLGSEEFFLQKGLLKHASELDDELRALIKNYHQL